MARELHGEVGQLLVAVMMELDSLRLDQPEIAERLRSTEGFLQQAITATRRIASDLRDFYRTHARTSDLVAWSVERGAWRIVTSPPPSVWTVAPSAASTAPACTAYSVSTRQSTRWRSSCALVTAPNLNRSSGACRWRNWSSTGKKSPCKTSTTIHD